MPSRRPRNRWASRGSETPNPEPTPAKTAEEGTGPQSGLRTDAAVQQALLARPGIGIRTRLALGFMSLFLLAAAVTGAAYAMLSRLEVRLRFLETADRFTMEIQQARRFEKNYFLYGTNLPDIQEHIQNAWALWAKALPDAESFIGRRDLATMENHLKRYRSLVDQLPSVAGPQAATERAAVEAELRGHGSELVTFAMELSSKERGSVNSTLLLFKRMPLVFLLVLLVLSVFIANSLARQFLGPLTRFMATTERIARGDFTPIKPARKYRDEFSNLAVALNTMMRELNHRQEVLVQSHKLRAIGTLTAGVAHELNNPINNITLTAEMLKEDFAELSDEERLDMVNDLVSQAERAQRIVRNLLDFARESEITTEKLDIGQLVERTVGLAANQIKLTGAKIHVEVPDNLPPIHGDRQSLSQVFVNLLLNALDAVGKGGRVSLRAYGPDQVGFLCVEVSDNGCGIPPHVLPYIFDPFFTTKSQGKGTGLGLSVSQGIIRQHGGDIRVQSEVEKGTTFTVLLPTVPVPGLKARE